MTCLAYTPNLLPQLTALINDHLSQVPPFWTFSQAQVASLLNVNTSWAVHYPEEIGPSQTEILCVLEQGKLIAAGQRWWHSSIEYHPASQAVPKNAILSWLVADPKAEDALQPLLTTFDEHCAKTRQSTLGTSRHNFGVGWFGIANTWPHLIKGLHQAGYTNTNRWLMMTGSTSNLPEISEPLNLPSMHLSRLVEQMSPQWRLRLDKAGELVGECEAWGIPAIFSACSNYEQWRTIEWIGVEEAYRRRGFGQWLLRKQLYWQNQLGITHIAVQTDLKNRATQCLNRKFGFQDGPECWEFEKRFD